VPSLFKVVRQLMTFTPYRQSSPRPAIIVPLLGATEGIAGTRVVMLKEENIVGLHPMMAVVSGTAVETGLIAKMHGEKGAAVQKEIASTVAALARKVLTHV
jgi:hypothetical protein